MAHNHWFNDEKYDPEATDALRRILNENQVLNQKISRIRMVIRSGADPHVLLEPINDGLVYRGQTPFEKLAVLGEADFLQELFGLGLEPTSKMLGELIKEFGFAPKNKQLRTIRAILDEDSELANELVDDFYVSGANYRKTTTPLILAVKRGVNEIVEILLERGANPNLQDANGRTALMYAVEQNKNTTPLLIRYGADLQLQNKRGFHARHYLRRNSKYVHLFNKENKSRNNHKNNNRNKNRNKNRKTHRRR
jgi:ankyrin repeat protein